MFVSRGLLLKRSNQIVINNVAVQFGGKRDSHFSKKEIPAAPFWSKFLPTQKLRENAKKRNLPAVAVINLHGVIAGQVDNFVWNNLGFFRFKESFNRVVIQSFSVLGKRLQHELTSLLCSSSLSLNCYVSC